MSPTLETKLAQLVSHIERQHNGVGAHKIQQDSVGVRYLLNDAEVAGWLDKHRASGLPTGPFLSWNF